ncbi:hypothetical protein BS47DRAFT_8322 [Hydnum rufescens UP504]|uniref:SRR1-like domain-containing protein n=1 Tax=Hydnum rufescens UP504 TaxID=1448309 RepID=A0A9P6BBC6_9AGAM|nr:hypothetical protein BS47DRAFT_8322 [Hydnum rufescens UP504]
MTARAQLDTLMTICTHFTLERRHVALYDPAFSRLDQEGLSALGFNVQLTNKLGKYDLAIPALLYMPHCSLKLQENFFRHNWVRAKLEKLLMISNDLALYADSIAAHNLQVTFPCTARLLPHLHSRKLPRCHPLPEAFNDMSFQYVAPGTLPPDSASDFWDLEPELCLGVSSDVEAIISSTPSGVVDATHPCRFFPRPEQRHVTGVRTGDSA